jgi:hypothetical protein
MTLLAGVVGAVAFSGAASASTLTPLDPAACYEQGTSVRLSGTGFTPFFSVVFLGSRGDSSAYPDADGVIGEGSVGMPFLSSFTPQSVTITAHGPLDPSNDSSITLQTARFGSNLPVRGKPGATVKWEFGGFPTGAAIYGHYRYGHNGPFKTVRDVRFGTATGPCGSLTKMAKRLPVKRPKRGAGWYLQVDTKPKFSANTRPEYDVTFAVH